MSDFKKVVIVTGGRDYDDFAMIADVLDALNPDLIVQGGASGADMLAYSYATAREIWVAEYPAEWDKYGKSAGPKRNIQMLEAYPDAIVVAFPGGKGTANCVKEAVARNMIVLRVEA